METLLGIGLLLGGIYMADKEVMGIAALLPIFILLIAKAWKKRITYPRLGYVEFSALRTIQRRNRKRLVLIGGLAAAGLALVVVLLRDDIISTHASRYIFGSVIVFILLLLVWVKRNLFLLAAPVLFAILLVVADIFHQRSYWACWGTGAVLFVWGIVRLIRFLRRNPPLKKEVGDGEIQ
ncbi:MAG: hypothetical protein ACOZB3_00110 [Calditrichota bacterium]